MIGVTSCGLHIPFYRLSRDKIGETWGRSGIAGERAVANFDEDAITMAVDAGIECLRGADRNQIDALFLASTTLPYKEKQSAAIVAVALDLSAEIMAVDFTSSIRAGTSALLMAINMVKSGAMKKILVIGSDCRLGAPRSDFELNFGDGAVALLVEDSGVAVNVVGSYTITDEIVDLWRTNEDMFVRSWEDRFILTQGYERNLRTAVSRLLKKQGLTPKDFAKAVVYAPDVRSHTAMVRSLGFDLGTQVQEPLFVTIGNTGSAFALLMLLTTLEEAKSGDRILLANYGDGADAFILEVTEHIEELKKRCRIKHYLASKAMLSNYQKYLTFREILATEPARRPGFTSSASILWRDRNGIYKLHAIRCQQCGTVQFPPQRVCINCQCKDQFDEVRLSEKKAEIFSFTQDYVFDSPDPPTVMVVVNFEGDGRMECHLTDRDPNQVKIGMPVEMTFRRLHQAGGFYNYFWKAKPIR
jgi:hydroxymethylglutaryl-CoA synthase